MENLLLQDDLNALLGGLSESATAVSKNEISGMEDLLSQDDLNALMGGLSESTTAVSKKEISGMEDLLSQDDLNALMGGLPESTIIKVSQQITISDIPAESESCGESMSQEEIDEMLRQFDRDI
jgi:hypothetical protein